MIDRNSLLGEWINAKAKAYSRDPTIIESMIFALYLLEQLSLTGLDFVFKGGTSLVLLMEKPQRFSVDIDIIVSPSVTREKMEAYIAKIISPEVFVRFELDEKRSYKEGIPKAHYKFIFASNFTNKDKEGMIVSNPEREILLDVLFADHQYPVIVKRPIQTEWLSHIGDVLHVSTPDINSITGDKLTAFAPNTTGVPYGMGKEREIMKHLFDIGCLFELLDNIEVFKQSFDATAKEEMKYRPERNIANVEEILQDTIATALLIARKDILKEEEERTKYNELDSGIKQFKHFVYSSNFRITDAQIASAKAAYLAAIILTKHTGELRRFTTTIPQTEYLIKHPEYNTLNKRLKFVGSGEALFYWYHTIGLLYPEA